MYVVRNLWTNLFLNIEKTHLLLTRSRFDPICTLYGKGEMRVLQLLAKYHLFILRRAWGVVHILRRPKERERDGFSKCLHSYLISQYKGSIKCPRVQNLMSSKFTGLDTRANASPDKERVRGQENWKICLRRMWTTPWAIEDLPTALQSVQVRQSQVRCDLSSSVVCGRTKRLLACCLPDSIERGRRNRGACVTPPP